MTAGELGFASAIPNSLDAVSDRDFLLDLITLAPFPACICRACARSWCWSTSEFGFIELSDAFSTGSSIMPQKRRTPDFAELIRGKTGRVIGNLVSLLVTMKALPSPTTRTFRKTSTGQSIRRKTLEDCLAMRRGNDRNHEHQAGEHAQSQAKLGHLAATDVADYLAKKGLPFRHAP